MPDLESEACELVRLWYLEELDRGTVAATPEARDRLVDLVVAYIRGHITRRLGEEMADP